MTSATRAEPGTEARTALDATFDEAVRLARDGLSPAAAAFLGHVRDNPQLLRRDAFQDLFDGIFATVGSINLMRREVAAPVQPWPVLIDADRRRRFERLAVGMARLVRSLPQRVFGGDVGRIAEFYGIDPRLAALLLAEPSGIEETLCRGDFIDSEQGPKCVEVNVGVLAGLSYSAFAPLYLRHPEIARFAAAHRLGLDHTDTIRRLFEHVVGATAGAPGRLGGKPLEILVVASDGRETAVDSHPRAVYERTLAEVAAAAGIAARVEVAPRSALRFTGAGVEAGGRRFDAVIEQVDVAPSEALFRAFKAGLVRLFTGAIGLITSDKRNLALLSRLRDSDLFDEDERALIREAVPWTRDVTPGLTSRGGRKLPMPDLLRREREALVLKPADAYGGAGVHVGPHTPPEEWARAVDRALAERGWVVQEYLPPRPQAFQAGEEGWAWHDLVWGLYVFGDRYAGVLIRLMPRGESAVVNISRGARIGVVLEADAVG
jgi:hypothetical protein